MTTSGSGSVVLAGGGTAGHTSPLIATGLELRRLGDGVRVTALGTARGLETSVVPAAGLQLELIPPVPMPRRVGKDFALLGPRLLQAVRATAQLLRRVEADVVLGFGGYVSTPAYLAARRLGLPVVIHEQNVLPGLANKLAARLTREVYTSFPQTSLPHARCIGLPMRRGITDLDRAALRREARMSFELDPELPTLLVSGGSQGALRINTAVAGAWPELLGSGIQVLHVLGPKNLVPGIERSVDQDERCRLPARGVCGADGAGLCCGRSHAGAQRCQHGAGDRGRRTSCRIRALPSRKRRAGSQCRTRCQRRWRNHAGRPRLHVDLGGPGDSGPLCASGPAHRNESSARQRCAPGRSYRVGVASFGGDALMGLLTPIQLPRLEELGAVHFIAIGGSGMNGIASMMLAQGIPVSGSDRQDSKYLRSLEAQGARVYVGHRADQLGDASTVVASSAIREDNPELAEARRRGLRVLHRSAALGSLMLGRRGIAVAGTHGKTTTTAMIAHVLSGCGLDPSFVIGGALTGTATGGHRGSGDIIVVEADESDGSFLQYPREVAVVTNIDPDHLSNWGSADNYADGFLRFATADSVRLLVTSADDLRSRRPHRADPAARGRRAAGTGDHDLRHLTGRRRANRRRKPRRHWLTFRASLG